MEEIPAPDKNDNDVIILEEIRRIEQKGPGMGQKGPRNERKGRTGMAIERKGRTGLAIGLESNEKFAENSKNRQLKRKKTGKISKKILKRASKVKKKSIRVGIAKKIKA